MSNKDLIDGEEFASKCVELAKILCPVLETYEICIALPVLARLSGQMVVQLNQKKSKQLFIGLFENEIENGKRHEPT